MTIGTIVINEWLPNPVGSSVDGEFVEFYNNGDAAVSVNGWTLETGAKKPKKISGVVPAKGYLVFIRKQTKLVLRNSDEGIALYDATGRLVDASRFVGSAPKGKSFSRIQIGKEPFPTSPWKREESAIQNFAWGRPTPGAVNEVAPITMTQSGQLPFGVSINYATASGGAFFVMMAGVAVLLTSLVLYSIKANEDLSDIFFNRDEAVG